MRSPLRVFGRLTSPLLLVGFWTFCAASAWASPLAFTGTLTVQFQGLPPVSVQGAGLAQINGVGVAGLPITQLSIPAGAFVLNSTVPPLTPISPIVQLGIGVANSTLFLSAAAGPCATGLAAVTCAGGGLQGRAGLTGAVTLGLSGVFGAPLNLLPVPVGVVGGGGVATGSNPTTGGTVMLSGAGWTTVAATAFSTFAGFPIGAITGMGGQGTTVGGRAFLQAVTPFAFRTNLLPGLRLGGIATLRLVFVPEPATGLLVALGAVGLGLYGRARRRHA